MNKKTSKVRIYELEWAGDMKKVTIEVPDYPKDILKYDDWFLPTIGELCFNKITGKISYVKDLTFQRPTHMWQGGIRFILADSKQPISEGLIVRIGVKKKKEFIFMGKKFVHTEPTDGGVIKALAIKRLEETKNLNV